jgi:hypothetical protein
MSDGGLKFLGGLSLEPWDLGRLRGAGGATRGCDDKN